MRAWYPMATIPNPNPLVGTMVAADCTVLYLSVDLTLDQDKTPWFGTSKGTREQFSGNLFDLTKAPIFGAIVQSTRDENAFNDHGARGIVYQEGGASGDSSQVRVGAQPWFPELIQVQTAPWSAWRMRLHFGGIMTNQEAFPGRHHQATDTERVRGVMGMIGAIPDPLEPSQTGNYQDEHVGGWGMGGEGPTLGGEGGFSV